MYKEYLNEGGHNKFEAFTIEYPSLLDECCKKGHISTKCKNTYYLELWYSFFRLYFLINILFE